MNEERGIDVFWMLWTMGYHAYTMCQEHGLKR